MSTSPPTAEVLAQAAARRLSNDVIPPDAQLMQDHEKRQKFRRLIDPGIFRPNSRAVAMNALKTLSKLAEHILNDPENTKYHCFKHENDTIKRRLIDPKGTLEYAIELGFRPQVSRAHLNAHRVVFVFLKALFTPEVSDFQPHYVFRPNHMDDLRIGAAVLRETLDRETAREEREERDRKEHKAAEAAIARNVMLAFVDDRKTKTLRDQRDRQLREARESARGSAQGAVVSSPSPEQSPAPMPGPGYSLVRDVQGDQPPPYQA